MIHVLSSVYLWHAVEWQSYLGLVCRGDEYDNDTIEINKII